jgi:hypothetical protein
MNEVDDQTQANVALTLEEKITDRVRKALVEVLTRGNADLYVQDMIDQRIRLDLNTIMQSPNYLAGNNVFREVVRLIVKQTVSEQMNKY